MQIITQIRAHFEPEIGYTTCLFEYCSKRRTHVKTLNFARLQFHVISHTPPRHGDADADAVDNDVMYTQRTPSCLLPTLFIYIALRSF